MENKLRPQTAPRHVTPHGHGSYLIAFILQLFLLSSEAMAQSWQSLGGYTASNIAAARNEDGRLEVFAVGSDYALWHIAQTRPNSWN